MIQIVGGVEKSAWCERFPTLMRLKNTTATTLMRLKNTTVTLERNYVFAYI
jgi:hypothetical protein